MSEAADLGFLYPALRGSTAGPGERLEEDLLGSVAEKARLSREANAGFFGEQGHVLVAAARTLAQTYGRGGRLFSMGNGGSSCDAAHVAVEFLHPVTVGRPALEAVDLTADAAMLLAVGNDVGFEHVFVRQLIARARAGDALIGFSTSGDSENLIAAFAKGRELGLTTLGMAGGDGGRMAASGLVDHCLVVPTASIHRVQERHVEAYHILWDLTHTLLACDRWPAS